jgi:multidrug transporter EmrE-like cation transporter
VINYLWLGLGGGLLTVGDIIFKYWVLKTSAPHYYVAGMLLYVLGAVCLIETYKSQNIAVATAIFVIFNIVSLVIASHFLFHEPLTLKQFAGIFAAIIAILLLH